MADNKLTSIEKIKTELNTVIKPVFEKIAPDMNYMKEAGFAIQILQNNTYLQGMEYNSIINSVRNVALTGLTLNPLLQQAYLVPRKGKCYLDISYKGMITLLTQYQVIKKIWATLVYEGEKFKIIEGFNHEIIHERRPDFYGKNIIAVYAIAKLMNDEFVFEVMDINEINEIMNRSESIKAGKGSPWNTDKSQMAKKTAIRRLYNQLPKTAIPERVVDTMGIELEANKIETTQDIINNNQGSEAFIYAEEAQEAKPDTNEPVINNNNVQKVKQTPVSEKKEMPTLSLFDQDVND